VIFNFNDFRDYLKDYFRRLPKRGYGEAKRIAAHLGVSSTYMSHVFNGSKQLTLEQGHMLAQYLGLAALEADYLFYLVEFDRAGTQDLKKYCQSKLQEIKSKSQNLVNRVQAKKLMTEQEKSIFYSTALFSAVHIYCSTSERGKNLEEIASRFDISRAVASETLKFLVEAQLCFQNGPYFTVGTQSTHLEAGSPYLLKHHINWRLRAIQVSEELKEEELMYTVNVSLAKKDFGLLREEMVQFIKKFLDRIHPSPSEEIATLNLDWFWIRK
jgi:uncharacterized protein (TIGR02147 family)